METFQSEQPQTTQTTSEMRCFTKNQESVDSKGLHRENCEDQSLEYLDNKYILINE